MQGFGAGAASGHVSWVWKGRRLVVQGCRKLDDGRAAGASFLGEEEYMDEGGDGGEKAMGTGSEDGVETGLQKPWVGMVVRMAAAITSVPWGALGGRRVPGSADRG